MIWRTRSIYQDTAKYITSTALSSAMDSFAVDKDDFSFRFILPKLTAKRPSITKSLGGALPATQNTVHNLIIRGADGDGDSSIFSDFMGYSMVLSQALSAKIQISMSSSILVRFGRVIYMRTF